MNILVTLWLCTGTFPCEPPYRYVLDPASCPGVVSEGKAVDFAKLDYVRHAVLDLPGRGDIDGNGSVDVDDITAILEVYAGERNETDSADVCGCVGQEAVIDVNDITGVLDAFRGMLPCQ